VASGKQDQLITPRKVLSGHRRFGCQRPERRLLVR